MKKPDLVDRFEQTSDEVPLDEDGVDEILANAGIDIEEEFERLLRRIAQVGAKKERGRNL